MNLNKFSFPNTENFKVPYLDSFVYEFSTSVIMNIFYHEKLKFIKNF